MTANPVPALPIHASRSTGQRSPIHKRCGRPLDAKPPRPCPAWRLSRPDGTSWKPCFACGAAAVPVAIDDAGPERVAAAIATARRQGTHTTGTAKECGLSGV